MTDTHAAAPPSARPTSGHPIARIALWLLLGGWFGAFLLFGAVVAPTAFAVLPSSQIAGTLVGPVITKLHLYGALAGVGIAGLSHRIGRPRWLSAIPLLLSAACLYSHFGISAEIDEIRDLAFGPEGSAAVAVRFGQLHRISMAIFIGVGLGVTALVGLHASGDARQVERSA